MNDSIAKAVVESLGGFDQLSGSIQKSDDTSLRASLLSKIDDELARFKVWAGNSGAHRTGRASLEHRLRDASHIRQQILRLLSDFKDTLEDAGDIITGKSTPWEETEDGEGPLDYLETKTEMDQIVLDITELVDCLLRLSVSIQNPAPHDRFMSSTFTDTSAYEDFDVQHVHAKFQEIDEGLAQRLGKAMSRRRQYFKYRAAHHDKLSHGLRRHGDTNKTETTQPAPSTIASSIPHQMKDEAPIDMSGDDTQSEGGNSVTSFATSVSGPKTLNVPPMPEEAIKGPFMCPFCYLIISVQDTRAWKKHVFRDLRPYNCLAPRCTEADREFSQRNEWMQHMLQNHLRAYRCPHGCTDNFSSAAESRDHLLEAHSGAIPDSKVDSIVQLSSQPLAEDAYTYCPFCLEALKSLKQYRRHVGKHQQDLALFVLPNTETGTGDDNSEETHSLSEHESEDVSFSEQNEEEITAAVKNQQTAADVEAENPASRQLDSENDYTWPITQSSNPCTIGSQTVDLHELFLAVQERGGYATTTARRLWVDVCACFDIDNEEESALKLMYETYLLGHDNDWIEETGQHRNKAFREAAKEKELSSFVSEGFEPRKPSGRNNTRDSRDEDKYPEAPSPSRSVSSWLDEPSSADLIEEDDLSITSGQKSNVTNSNLQRPHSFGIDQGRLSAQIPTRGADFELLDEKVTQTHEPSFATNFRLDGLLKTSNAASDARPEGLEHLPEPIVEEKPEPETGLEPELEPVPPPPPVAMTKEERKLLRNEKQRLEVETTAAPPPPPPSSDETGARAKALYDFTSKSDRELAVLSGETVNIIHESDNGTLKSPQYQDPKLICLDWSLAEGSEGNGWVPSAYFEKEAPSSQGQPSVIGNPENIPTLSSLPAIKMSHEIGTRGRETKKGLDDVQEFTDSSLAPYHEQWVHAAHSDLEGLGASFEGIGTQPSSRDDQKSTARFSTQVLPQRFRHFVGTYATKDIHQAWAHQNQGRNTEHTSNWLSDQPSATSEIHGRGLQDGGISETQDDQIIPSNKELDPELIRQSVNDLKGLAEALVELHSSYPPKPDRAQHQTYSDQNSAYPNPPTIPEERLTETFGNIHGVTQPKYSSRANLAASSASQNTSSLPDERSTSPFSHSLSNQDGRELKPPLKNAWSESPGGPSDSEPEGISGQGNENKPMCTNCFTQHTPLWRRDSEGKVLCNACGLFYKLHGIVRPLSLKNDVIRKKSRDTSGVSTFSKKSAAKSAAPTKDRMD